MEFTINNKAPGVQPLAAMPWSELPGKALLAYCQPIIGAPVPALMFWLAHPEQQAADGTALVLAEVKMFEEAGVHRLNGLLLREYAPQRAGLGSILLDLVCNYADCHQLTLLLTPQKIPTASAGLSTVQLKKWYARRGFVAGMVRRPLRQEE